MIPGPVKTYSRKANQSTASVSSYSYKSQSDESEKENKRAQTRPKKKGRRKNCEKEEFKVAVDANASKSAFEAEDLFDKLLSSPPKQEVVFKPLSHWATKLKDLEEKEKEKKKAKGLFEFSDGSDSDESYTFARKKKVKKKPATKKKKKGFAFDFTNIYSKKKKEPTNVKGSIKVKESTKVKSKTAKPHEGAVIKERVLLNKEKEKLKDKEDKFTFKKSSSLMGITSTPAPKKNEINLVGTSKFSFFSPILNGEATPILKPPDFDLSSIHAESEITTATPKVRKTRKMVSQDLDSTLKNETVMEKDSKKLSGCDSLNVSTNFFELTVQNITARPNEFLGFESKDKIRPSFLLIDDLKKLSLENNDNNFVNSEFLVSNLKTDESAKDSENVEKDLMEDGNISVRRKSSCEFLGFDSVDMIRPSFLLINDLEKISLKNNVQDFVNSEFLVSNTTLKTDESVRDSENLEKDLLEDKNQASFTSAHSNFSFSSDKCDEKTDLLHLALKYLRRLKTAKNLNYVKSYRIKYPYLNNLRVWKSTGNIFEDDNWREKYYYSDNDCGQRCFVNEECDDVENFCDEDLENNFTGEDAEYNSAEDDFDGEIGNDSNLALEDSHKNITIRSRCHNFSRFEKNSSEESEKYFSGSDLSREDLEDGHVEENTSGNFLEKSGENFVKLGDNVSLPLETVDNVDEDYGRNVTIRRGYYKASRMEDSVVENSRLYKTAIEDLQNLTMKEDCSQYLKPEGSDSSGASSSIESEKTVRKLDSLQESNEESTATKFLSIENTLVPTKMEEIPQKVLSTDDTPEKIQMKTPNKFLSVEDTFLSSPLPIFESTVCEPRNEDLESTRINPSEKNRQSDWNFSRISVLPVLESTVCEAPINEKLESTRIQPLRKNKKSDWNLSRISTLPPVFESSLNESQKEKLESTRMVSFKKNKNLDENSTRISTLQQPLETTAMCDLQNISVNLKPGKKWMRSLSVIHQLQNQTLAQDGSGKGRNYMSFVQEVLEMQPAAFQESIIHPDKEVSRLSTTMTNLTRQFSNMEIFNRQSQFIEAPSDERDCSIANVTAVKDITMKPNEELTARNVVLMRCNQEEPLSFSKYFNKKTLKNCKKIGEGVYGEVFMYGDTVIKIIPIEGDFEVNGDRQKKFEEVLSEIVTAMELSNLRQGDVNRCSGFNQLKRCWCVMGEYPEYLVQLWEDYDQKSKPGSENDHPSVFGPEQLYIVLELAYGGRDLEAFEFNSAREAYSVLLQTVFSLAVAEKALEFEHRDLHWGNILINTTKEKSIQFVVDGDTYSVPTYGVEVSIIDFTLSRLTYENVCLFNDLAIDPSLFTSSGDYQFDIYRMMQKEVSDTWSLFRPMTNIFWLHYVSDKMLKMVRYKNPRLGVHRDGKKTLNKFYNTILNFTSSGDFILRSEIMEEFKD